MASFLQADETISSRIEARLPQMRGALQKVARHVLSEPAKVSRSTIIELAEATQTSPGTVQRFCRMIGLNGYPELRLGIAAELGAAAQVGWDFSVGEDMAPSDAVERIQRTIFAADLWTMRHTVAQLDAKALEQAADAIVGARRIQLYGVGNSAVVAGLLYERLLGIDLPVWIRTEVHAGLATATLLGSEDVAIAISHSGATREVVEILAEAAGRRATTIALTNSSLSPLAGIADIVLSTAVRETPFRPGTFSAQHSQLLVLDTLYVCVAHRIYKQADRSIKAAREAVEVHRALNSDRQRQPRGSTSKRAPVQEGSHKGYRRRRTADDKE